MYCYLMKRENFLMRKHLLAKFTAAAICGALSLGTLTACDQKKVTLDNEQVMNFTAPEQGEKIAVITFKDYGDVKIKLFPEACEKGVENFMTHIENGYYDELIMHRVVKNFVIQGGDPTGTGGGGEDCWGNEGFAQCISPDLHHFVGAVAYAVNAMDKLNGSQFYIVTGEAINEDYLKNLAAGYGKSFSEQVQKMYYQFGGQPFLDNDYEVFGQVFDGLDVCLEIQNVAVDEASKPFETVMIEKAEIVEYDGSGTNYRDHLGEIQVPGGSDNK